MGIFVSLRQIKRFMYFLGLVACFLLKGTLTPSQLEISRYRAHLFSVYTALPYALVKMTFRL